MDAQLKKTIIIVGSSTVIGFVGDVVMYSVAASKGGPFKIQIPKGKALLQVVVLGFVTGLVVDWVTNQIVESQKTPAEKDLDALVKADVERLAKGEIKGKPVKIQWSNAAGQTA